MAHGQRGRLRDLNKYRLDGYIASGGSLYRLVHELSFVAAPTICIGNARMYEYKQTATGNGGVRCTRSIVGPTCAV